MSSDPAEDAAERAIEKMLPRKGTYDALDLRVAAREALAPIQAEHARFADYADKFAPGQSDYVEGVRVVINALRPLIYPIEKS